MKSQVSLEIVLIVLLTLLLLNFTLYIVNLKLIESEASIQLAKARVLSNKLKDVVDLISSRRGSTREIITLEFPENLTISLLQPNLLSLEINFHGKGDQFFIFSNLPIDLKIPKNPSSGERKVLVVLENNSIEIKEVRELLEIEPSSIYLSLVKNSSKGIDFKIYSYSSELSNISFYKAGELSENIHVDELFSELENCTLIESKCYNNSDLIFENLPTSYSMPKFGFIELRGNGLKFCLIDSKDDNEVNYDLIYFLNLSETNIAYAKNFSIDDDLSIFDGTFRIFNIGSDFSYLKIERTSIENIKESVNLSLNISIPLLLSGRYGATLIAKSINSSSSMEIFIDVLSLPIQSLEIVFSNSSDFSFESTRFLKNSTLFYKIKAIDILGAPGEGEVEVKIQNPSGEIMYSKIVRFNQYGEFIDSFFIPIGSPSGKWSLIALIPEKNYWKIREFEVFGEPSSIKIFTFSDEELKNEVNSFARGNKLYYLIEVLDNESYPTNALLNITFLDPSGDQMYNNIVYIYGTYNNSFYLPLDAELGEWKILASEVNYGISENKSFYVVKNILIHNAYIVTDKIYYLSGNMIKVKLSVEDQNFQPFANLGNRIRVDVKRSEGTPDYSFTGDNMSYKCLGIFECPLSLSCCYTYEFNSSILLSNKVYFLDVKINDPVKDLIVIYESRSFKVVS